jgi:predicted nucleotidyltransferase
MTSIVDPGPAIPGLPRSAQEALIAVLSAQPELKSVWLFGSRAMGRERTGSDVDLCLDAPGLAHADRLRLMAAVDDLCLPWHVDLVLSHELPADMAAHVHRVGRCLWHGGAASGSQTAEGLA